MNILTGIKDYILGTYKEKKGVYKSDYYSVEWTLKKDKETKSITYSYIFTDLKDK